MKITTKKFFEVVSLNGFVLWSFGYRSDRNAAYDKAFKAMNALFNSGRVKGLRLVENVTTVVNRLSGRSVDEKRIYVGALGCKIDYGSSPRKITINEATTRKIRDKAEKIVNAAPEVFTPEENELLANFDL